MHDFSVPFPADRSLLILKSGPLNYCVNVDLLSNRENTSEEQPIKHNWCCFVWESVSLFNSIIAVSCWDTTLLPHSVTQWNIWLFLTQCCFTHAWPGLLCYSTMNSHVNVLDAHKSTLFLEATVQCFVLTCTSASATRLSLFISIPGSRSVQI